MSRTPMHPDEEELLRFADGELASRRAGEVRRHLESCWECRAGLERLQSVIGECVRYRKEVLQAHLPAPPAPWADIRLRFAELDAEPEPVRERLARLLRFPVRTASRWVPVAAALAVVCGLVYQLRETPSVQAAALLRKAVAAAEAGPPAPRRIRIRTAKRQVTRVLGAARPASAPADIAGMEALFQAAHYNWEDPLSARSFQQWRESLPDGHDEVTSSPQGYRIRTTSPKGELAEASLKLRSGDLRPVEGRLEFRNREWVEIAEAPAEPAPAPVAIAAALPAADATVPVPEPAVRPLAAATPVEELRVLSALHRLGADLGDPIEVSRAGSRVLVSGVGLDPHRRQEVEAALEGLPNVDIRFADPAPAATLPAPSAAETASGASQGPLQTRLEREAGGRPRFERLATELLEASDAAMARAYALRRLAQKFPAGAEADLGAEGRRVLGKLDQEHATALMEQSVAMDRLAGPLLVSLGGSAGEPSQPAPANWQAAAEEALLASRRVETLLAETLGLAAGETPAEQLPSELLAALARLRTAAQACGRLAPVESRK